MCPFPTPKNYNGITLARSNIGMLEIICKYTNRGVCVINGNLTFSVELWEKLLKLAVGETYHPFPPPLVALHTQTHTCARACAQRIICFLVVAASYLDKTSGTNYFSFISSHMQIAGDTHLKF